MQENIDRFITATCPEHHTGMFKGVALFWCEQYGHFVDPVNALDITERPIAQPHYQSKKSTLPAHQPQTQGTLLDNNYYSADEEAKSLIHIKSVPVFKCRHKTKISLNGGTIIAHSKLHEPTKDDRVDLHIYLDDSYIPMDSILVNFRSRLPRSTRRCVYVNWPDFGSVSLDILGNLILYTKELLRQGKVVSVGCIGGHGRTGTFLATLVAVTMKIEGKQAVSWVRSNYCKMAVENTQQEALVEKLAGVFLE